MRAGVSTDASITTNPARVLTRKNNDLTRSDQGATFWAKWNPISGGGN
jgi:hypothetical protein